jgi:hypothetical protein
MRITAPLRPKRKLLINPRTVNTTIHKMINAVLFISVMRSNVQHQRWEPAAAYVRTGTELNGWLPSAACCGFGLEFISASFTDS